MKRDPHTVYEACRELTPEAWCEFCANDLNLGTKQRVIVRLQEHKIDCPLRIVIEAALESTEATESEGE